MDLSLTIECRVAVSSDIADVLALHYKYHVDSIGEEDKPDGFVTTPFTQEHMLALIEQEGGLFVALAEGRIVAYAMSASWGFWSRWPMFQYMIDDLPNLHYQGIQLTAENSYQYGPVCVDKSVRGHGVFQAIFNYALNEMALRYPIIVTFINKTNTRSMQAHTRKVKLDIIQEFTFNNNQYYELACKTKVSNKYQ